MATRARRDAIWKSFFIIIGATLAVCVFLGAVFALFTDLSMWESLQIMIVMVGISGVISAVLEGASEKMRKKNFAFGFGIAIYYGAVMLCCALWDIEDLDVHPWRMIVALAISGAVAWIAWEKYFKDR